MRSITQYFPGFFEGFDPETVEFETEEKLFDIPFVKKFKAKRKPVVLTDILSGRQETPKDTLGEFVKWDLSREMLRALYEKGALVVGFIKHEEVK